MRQDITNFKAGTTLPQSENRTSEFPRGKVKIRSGAVDEHSFSSTSDTTASVAHAKSSKKVRQQRKSATLTQILTIIQ